MHWFLVEVVPGDDDELKEDACIDEVGYKPPLVGVGCPLPVLCVGDVLF